MKRMIVAAILAALAVPSAVNAQDQVDTVRTKVDTIIISSTGRSADKKHVHLDFDIPFYHKIQKNDGYRTVVGNAGIGSIFSDSKAPLDFSPQNSLEFWLYALSSHTKGHSTLSYGPGISFRNLALTGGGAMNMSDNGAITIGPFPEGTSPKISRLTVFSFNMPLLYSCSFGGGFGFTVGPVVNLNASSSIVNKYSINGDGQKDKFKHVHCNIVTVDALFQLNLKYFSIYAKYSPMNLMDKKYWPEFTTWTFGIAPF